MQKGVVRLNKGMSWQSELLGVSGGGCIRMLVHIVSLGGVAVAGPKDIMAFPRAWAHSFAGLRRLHSFHSLSFSGTWQLPTIERNVQQNSTSSRHLRFSAHAAALEESPNLHPRRGVRLSRTERYALVENFVLRHKDTHEGKWPSVTVIVKEIGGSRLIVKDIVDELEKNSKTHRETEPLSTEKHASDTSTKPHGRSVEQLVGADIEKEQQDTSLEADTNRLLDNQSTETDLEQTVPTNDKTAISAGQSNPRSGEIDTNPGLWRRLRNLGQQESQTEAERERDSSPAHAQAQAPSVSFDSFDSDLDEDEDDDESDFAVDTHEGRDPEHGEVSEKHTKHSNAGLSSESNTGESYGMFIRFLPLAASEMDLRAAFQDCGEIVRAQAMVPKGSGLKFTYGFVDFSTPDALSKALRKEKVFIKGSAILTEACSGSRRPGSGRKSAPEPFKKAETYRNSDTRPANGTRGSLSQRFKPIGSHLGNDNGSRSSHSNGLYLVAVEGLPYPMPISAVEKMLSAHGDISRSELAREDGGTYSAHVEFKTEEARDSALASNRVYLGGRWCRVTTGEPILTTVVRLSNVGNASENFILQRCGKVGRVDNIVQRKEGIVDVYYHPSERRNMRKILDRLGDVNADFKRWHANLAPKCSVEEIRNSAEIQDWVEGQKDRLLENLTGAMKLMIIDLEDLQELVDAERRDLSYSAKYRNFDRFSSPKSTRS